MTTENSRFCLINNLATLQTCCLINEGTEWTKSTFVDGHHHSQPIMDTDVEQMINEADCVFDDRGSYVHLIRSSSKYANLCRTRQCFPAIVSALTFGLMRLVSSNIHMVIHAFDQLKLREIVIHREDAIMVSYDNNETKTCTSVSQFLEAVSSIRMGSVWLIYICVSDNHKSGSDVDRVLYRSDAKQRMFDTTTGIPASLRRAAREPVQLLHSICFTYAYQLNDSGSEFCLWLKEPRNERVFPCTITFSHVEEADEGTPLVSIKVARPSHSTPSPYACLDCSIYRSRNNSKNNKYYYYAQIQEVCAEGGCSVLAPRPSGHSGIGHMFVTTINALFECIGLDYAQLEDHSVIHCGTGAPTSLRLYEFLRRGVPWYTKLGFWPALAIDQDLLVSVSKELGSLRMDQIVKDLANTLSSSRSLLESMEQLPDVASVRELVAQIAATKGGLDLLSSAIVHPIVSTATAESDVTSSLVKSGLQRRARESATRATKMLAVIQSHMKTYKLGPNCRIREFLFIDHRPVCQSHAIRLFLSIAKSSSVVSTIYQRFCMIGDVMVRRYKMKTSTTTGTTFDV